MAKRRFLFVYRLLLIVSLFLGIFLNLKNTESVISMLSYYTLQSNIICLFAFVVLFIFELFCNTEKNDIYYFIKGAITIDILVTAIVYSIGLAPNGFHMEIKYTSVEKHIADMLVHVVSPILVLFDYFFFDIKGKFKKYYPFLWLLFPIEYLGYVYVYQSHGGRFYSIGGSEKFAYFFLDYNKIGIERVVLWILFITVGILLLGYSLLKIDSNLREASV